MEGIDLICLWIAELVPLSATLFSFIYGINMLTLEDTFFFNIYNAGLSFIDCEFGDATFHNKEAAQFVDTEASNGPIASIFGGGSLAMIVSLLALIVAGAALAVNISAKKKEDSPAEANSEE